MDRVRATLTVEDELRALAAGSYPLEGCGVLLGHLHDEHNGGDTVVLEVLPGHNLVTERANDRYELDPRDILVADRRARDHGIDVVGFWHTHPEHPAEPSRFDTERAWPEYVYAICSTVRSGVEEIRWWRLRSGSDEFVELYPSPPD